MTDHENAERERAERIAGIQARHEAASPGPWTAESEDIGHNGKPVLELWIRIPSKSCATLFLDAVPTPEKFYFEWTNNFRDAQAKCDVEFIASAPSDVAFLLSEVARLKRLSEEALANLTRVQAVSTDQCNQLRGIRLYLNGAKENVFRDIVGNAYASVCKHGDFIPRLLHIEDGTGGADAIAFRAIAKAECEAGERGDKPLTWRALVEEEISEAFAETEPRFLAGELAQTMVAIAAWMEAIEIREASK